MRILTIAVALLLLSVSGLLLISVGTASAHPAYPADSIYNLSLKLIDQDGTAHGLDLHRGKPVLITMFYGSCPMACPLLIDTLRRVDESVAPAERKNLRVLMISIDPDRDTPQALKKLAESRHIDQSRWTLAQTDERAVRKIAALLNIQYRELPDGGFNHASIITLIDEAGTVKVQSSTIGKADPALIDAIAHPARSQGR